MRSASRVESVYLPSEGACVNSGTDSLLARLRRMRATVLALIGVWLLSGLLLAVQPCCVAFAGAMHEHPDELHSHLVGDSGHDYTDQTGNPGPCKLVISSGDDTPLAPTTTLSAADGQTKVESQAVASRNNEWMWSSELRAPPSLGAAPPPRRDVSHRDIYLRTERLRI